MCSLPWIQSCINTESHTHTHCHTNIATTHTHIHTHTHTHTQQYKNPIVMHRHVHTHNQNTHMHTHTLPTHRDVYIPNIHMHQHSPSFVIIIQNKSYCIALLCAVFGFSAKTSCNCAATSLWNSNTLMFLLRTHNVEWPNCNQKELLTCRFFVTCVKFTESCIHTKATYHCRIYQLWKHLRQKQNKNQKVKKNHTHKNSYL
jgi:hypothetical protein